MGLGDIVRTGRVGPVDVERDVELADGADQIFGEQAAGGARQAGEAVVLGDHVFDAGLLAGGDHALGGLVVVAQGLLAEQVQTGGEGLHGDFFVDGRRGYVEDKVGLRCF